MDSPIYTPGDPTKERSKAAKAKSKTEKPKANPHIHFSRLLKKMLARKKYETEDINTYYENKYAFINQCGLKGHRAVSLLIDGIKDYQLRKKLTNMKIKKPEEFTVRYQELALHRQVEDASQVIFENFNKVLHLKKPKKPFRIFIPNPNTYEATFAALLKKMLARKKHDDEDIQCYFMAKFNLIKECKFKGERAVSLMIDGIKDCQIKKELRNKKIVKIEYLMPQYVKLALQKEYEDFVKSKVMQETSSGSDCKANKMESAVSKPENPSSILVSNNISFSTDEFFVRSKRTKSTSGQSRRHKRKVPSEIVFSEESEDYVPPEVLKRAEELASNNFINVRKFFADATRDESKIFEVNIKPKISSEEILKLKPEKLSEGESFNTGKLPESNMIVDGEDNCKIKIEQCNSEHEDENVSMVKIMKYFQSEYSNPARTAKIEKLFRTMYKQMKEEEKKSNSATSDSSNNNNANSLPASQTISGGHIYSNRMEITDVGSQERYESVQNSIDDNSVQLMIVEPAVVDLTSED